MAKINQIRRLIIIIRKLSGPNRYVHAAELTEYVERTIRTRYSDTAGCTQRTLQRDFQTIEELFHIAVRHDKLKGYYIAECSENAGEYESLLTNFELLSSIDADSVIQKYVLPEHRRAGRSPYIPELLDAIRECRPIEFDYDLIRHGNTVVHKRLKPHFLKESQQRWYLIGYDETGTLKTFGLERISMLRVMSRERFERDDSIDIPALFRDSFGIWNNAADPVEEVVLKYDSLDGAFVKTMPLHTTQEIVEETTESITVRLRVRITNDFVMALLARSRSVEVVKPLSLRQRIYETFLHALERNRPHDDE